VPLPDPTQAGHPLHARMQEGETRDAGVLALRGRQMRNLMLALMTSQGTPMVLMGARPPVPSPASAHAPCFGALKRGKPRQDINSDPTGRAEGTSSCKGLSITGCPCISHAGSALGKELCRCKSQLQHHWGVACVCSCFEDDRSTVSSVVTVVPEPPVLVGVHEPHLAPHLRACHASDATAHGCRTCASYASLRATWLIRTGDEYAATRGGNNNWYGHDTALTRFDWDELDAQRSTFFRFYRCRERHVCLLSSVAPKDLTGCLYVKSTDHCAVCLHQPLFHIRGSARQAGRRCCVHNLTARPTVHAAA